MTPWEHIVWVWFLRLLFWGLGITAAWCLLTPWIGLPRLFVALRLRTALIGRVLRPIAFLVLLCYLPYGGLLALEMVTAVPPSPPMGAQPGIVSDWPWLRDRLLDHGFGPTYIADRLYDEDLRAYAYVTMCGIIPALGIALFFHGPISRRLRSQASSARLNRQQLKGQAICAKCGYDQGTEALPEAICPECGSVWSRE